MERDGKLGRSMMKTLALACCIACLSCARRPDAVTLENGYSFQVEQVSRGTTRWTLRRDTPEQSGVVAQAIVADDEVLSVLPTPIRSSSSLPARHAGRDFFLIPHAGETPWVFLLHRDGSISFRDRQMDPTHFARIVERLKPNSSDLSVVLQIETPCAWAAFIGAITLCTSIGDGGFGVTYKGSSRGPEVVVVKEVFERDELAGVPGAATQRNSDDRPYDAYCERMAAAYRAGQ